MVNNCDLLINLFPFCPCFWYWSLKIWFISSICRYFWMYVFFFSFHLYLCISYLVYLVSSSRLVLVRDMTRCWLLIFWIFASNDEHFNPFLVISIRGFVKLPYFVAFLSCCRMHLSASYSILSLYFFSFDWLTFHCSIRLVPFRFTPL